MSFFKLVIRSFWYFRRQHLALFAGTLISTAVLTGALIIGDSVKHSLRQLVDLRLGNTRYALQTGDRFVRAELADDLANAEANSVTALLMVDGICRNPENSASVNNAQVAGIDESFWALSGIDMPPLNQDEAIISENTANRLGINVGEEFLLRLRETSEIPLNAPFAEDVQNSIGWRLTVKHIAGKDHLGRFSLKSNQAAPFNIFVSREQLAAKLDLEGLANVILMSGKDGRVEEINRIFPEVWQIEDAGLQFTEIDGTEKFDLVSNRIFIDQYIADIIAESDFKSEPIQTYLVNSIRFNEKATPYSFITAGNQLHGHLKLDHHQIDVNEWLADDLDVGPGDTLTIDYFTIGPFRQLEEKSSGFVVRNVIPMISLKGDESLMPQFPGLADAGSCRDWETGVPIDLDRIRDKDEKYWDNYKGTPKAFISMEMGEQIWSNQFGNYTAFRFDKTDIAKADLEKKLISQLKPIGLGMQFTPVYSDGLAATTNAVDFGELFLSLSFFVIAAGVLLTMMLFALSMESRKKEAGILAAMGFRNRQIAWFRMAETSLVVVLGSIVGAFAGILYNYAIMAGLNSVWQDVVRTNMIDVFIRPQTLIIGAASGIVIAALVILFITRSKLKQPLVELIKISGILNYTTDRSKHFLNLLLIIGGFTLSALSVVFTLQSSGTSESGMFMMAGGLFLVGCLALVYRILILMDNVAHQSTISGRLLALKNVSRKRGRSITAISLLALGVFTIMITGANQKTFYGADTNRISGTGGYSFWIETTSPIIYDMNTSSGQEKYGLESNEISGNIDFLQFHVLDGDDASCLNLNQVSRPRILGIDPGKMDERESFSFANLIDGIDPDHPWLGLNNLTSDGLIPAFADQTVITWGLMMKVGDTLTYLNEQGEEIKLLLAGGLNNSIFQGNLLIADEAFRENFPSVSGSRIMLVDARHEDRDKSAEILQSTFTDLGIEMQTTSARLAEFNSVTNTYLAVFMALGGLGVLIGTLGLGILLLRNMLERKRELALLLALGFRKKMVIRLIVSENLILLLCGIIVGVLSAFIGILPSLLSPAFLMNTGLILLILLIIFTSGLAWIYFPARSALRNLPVDALRTE
jgi:ABC-type antimicrobial peptide transport system permease subunit